MIRFGHLKSDAPHSVLKAKVARKRKKDMKSGKDQATMGKSLAPKDKVRILALKI
jgi:hypothetical protein